MTIRDDVLAALDTDAPRSRQTVADELGLDHRQAGNALDQLRALKRCKRVAEGWLRTGEAATPPEAIAIKPAKRAYKKRAKKAVEPLPRKRVRQTGALRFALTDERMIAIERHDGSGERALISGADAIRLCDFIATIRAVIEA